MEEKNKNEQPMNQPHAEGSPDNTSESSIDTTQGTSDAVSTEPQSNETTPQTTTPSAIPWTLIVAVVVVVGLLAGGVWWLSQSSSTGTELGATPDGTPTTPTFSAEDYPDVIAVVNGTELTADRFIQGMEQAVQQAAQQGANPEDAELRGQIEDQTVTALVNTELLLQAATEAGITVEESDIDAEIDSIVQQFGSEEVFQEQLNTAGLTLEELRADFAEQLTIDAFIRQTPEWAAVELEPGEAQAFYDDVVAQNEGQEVPAFAEVEGVIEEQLLGTKQQEITQEIIDRLRAEADIEVRL